MAVYEFYSIIENSKEDNCYIVNFPYTWGCFTYGDTLLEAVEMVEEALILMRTCMGDDGDDIPPASPTEKLIEQLPKGAVLWILLSIPTNIERWID